VIYSHKTHEKAAELLLAQLGRIKLAQIILSAVTTAGFASVLLGSGWIGAAVGALISTVLLTLNAYTKDYDLGEMAQEHKQTANDLWAVREQYLSLLVDFATGQLPLGTAQARRDELQGRLAAIYQAAPNTSSPAYHAAQRALQVHEDMTFSAEEIDRFLPTEIRRSRPSGNTQP
jgi:hypothetical protein